MTLDGAFARCIFLAALAAGVDSRSCAKLLAFAAMRRLFIRYDGTFSSCGRCVLVAASIDRPAAAAGRHVRRAQCVVARVTRQLRDAPGSANCSAARQPAYLSHTGRSLLAVGETRSCDRFWCYENGLREANLPFLKMDRCLEWKARRIRSSGLRATRFQHQQSYRFGVRFGLRRQV